MESRTKPIIMEQSGMEITGSSRVITYDISKMNKRELKKFYQWLYSMYPELKGKLPKKKSSK